MRLFLFACITSPSSPLFRTIAPSHLLPFLPKNNNTGTAYLAVNSSKDSSWWGSWASTSPANLPAETEKAARWTGCWTKSALGAGRAKGVARARDAQRIKAETDIVIVVVRRFEGAERRWAGVWESFELLLRPCC